MSNVLDNYVSYGGDYLAQHPTYRSMLAEIFQITMASEQLGANDRVCVCKMAGQTLLSLTGYMDQVRAMAFCGSAADSLAPRSTSRPTLSLR